MLDDQKLISERDPHDALGIATNQWQQLTHSFDIAPLEGTFDNVVHAGMGGSALWAMVSLSWPGYNVPFDICRDYEIPGYVSERTLFVAASYSGNTEEAIAALEAAAAKKAKIVVIASGGKLVEIAQQRNYPLALLPKAGQPRYALLSGFKALVTFLERANMVSASGAEQAIHQASQFLHQAISAWLPTVSTKDNLAKQIAEQLVGKSAVVYAGPKLFPAAYKWKISINENAKQIAWCNQLPEFNHNEMNGWAEKPDDKPYAVIELRSKLEHPRTFKRFAVTQQLLKGMRPEPIVIEPQGDDLLEQLLWAIALGDFVSLYLAILNNVNPTPVDLVEAFKKKLDE